VGGRRRGEQRQDPEHVGGGDPKSISAKHLRFWNLRRKLGRSCIGPLFGSPVHEVKLIVAVDPEERGKAGAISSASMAAPVE
jgi:hypothetical protein